MARRVASARDIDESPRYAAGKLMLRNAPARTWVMTAPQKYRTSPLPAAIPSGFARSPASSPTAPATFTAPSACGHESGTPTSCMNLSTNGARAAAAAPIPPVAAAVTIVSTSTGPGVAATMWVRRSARTCPRYHYGPIPTLTLRGHQHRHARRAQPFRPQDPPGYMAHSAVSAVLLGTGTGGRRGVVARAIVRGLVRMDHRQWPRCERRRPIPRSSGPTSTSPTRQVRVAGRRPAGLHEHGRRPRRRRRSGARRSER